MLRRNFLAAMVAAIAAPLGPAIPPWRAAPSGPNSASCRSRSAPCPTDCVLAQMLVMLNLERPVAFELVLVDGDIIARIDNQNPETIAVEGMVSLRRIGGGDEGHGLYQLNAEYLLREDRRTQLVPLSAALYLPRDSPPLTIRDPMQELARSETWTVIG